jgi:hypothetical protein
MAKAPNGNEKYIPELSDENLHFYKNYVSTEPNDLTHFLISSLECSIRENAKKKEKQRTTGT